mmetsp:Transcript_97541/g.314408  ORF Transcript_97541/g.314408 Transcript_97541/m.314408 type:complete len:265 (-) Transcript_97541:354-1148(-)
MLEVLDRLNALALEISSSFRRVLCGLSLLLSSPSAHPARRHGHVRLRLPSERRAHEHVECHLQRRHHEGPLSGQGVCSLQGGPCDWRTHQRRGPKGHRRDHLQVGPRVGRRVLRALVLPHAWRQRRVRQHVRRLQDGRPDRLRLELSRGQQALPRHAALRAPLRRRDRRLLLPQRRPPRHAHGRGLHNVGPLVSVLRAGQGAPHPLRLRHAPRRLHRRQNAAAALQRRCAEGGHAPAEEHQALHRRQGDPLLPRLGAGVLRHPG